MVDASVAVHAILGLPLAQEARRLVFSDAGAAAPDLLNAEVLHTIRAHERRGRLAAGRSREAIEDLLDLPITRYPSLQLTDRAWQLRHNFTAYDAMYVALAEALETSFVTADGNLARAVASHALVPVVLLE